MDSRAGRSISRGMLPFLAVHALSEYYRSDSKPPVTAGILAANTLIYLRPGVLDNILPTINEVWFNPYLIVKYGDLKRFLLSPFYHVGETHLVYNMMSLVWKGIQLESSMGSVEYTAMVASLLGLSQTITLLLAKSLVLFGYDTPFYIQNSVGFSGVLFAMKVVLNSQADSDYTSVNGLVVPSRYAAWAELILIQMFTPEASFLGHLSGILAGMLYVGLKRGAFPGRNPVEGVIRGVVGVLSWPVKFVRGLFRRRRITGRGTVGGGVVHRRGGDWRCAVCTFENSGWMDACEICSAERNDSEPNAASRVSNPPLEELRRRRIERYT
ncbi:hypothetical protein ACHQM5_012917 [Ranunculus cassubicifolius]